MQTRSRLVRLVTLTTSLALVATLAASDGPTFVHDITSSVPRTVAGSAPAQHSGTAASRSHKAKTASTAAPAKLRGRSTASAPDGALPPDQGVHRLKLPGKPRTADQCCPVCCGSRLRNQ
jgi:hypothetical protein